MADHDMMLRDLESFRGGAKRPWVLIVGIVVLCTIGLVWLLRYLDGKSADPEDRKPVPSETEEARPRSRRPRFRKEKSRATDVAEKTASAIPSEIQGRMGLSRSLESAGELYAARTNLLSLLDLPEMEPMRKEIEERLGRVNVRLVSAPHQMPEKIDYSIQSGDSLKVLARRFGTTIELLVKSNNISNPDRIQINDRLRILNKARFEIHVRKQANDLLVTMNGRFFKRYVVGTGSYGRTPVGTFKIQDKVENPPWWSPDGGVIPFGDPKNILGTRWMSITATGDTPPARGYGLHGTWDNSTLGSQSSAGCVRMRNSEVEELYMMIPEGTAVKITD